MERESKRDVARRTFLKGAGTAVAGAAAATMAGAAPAQAAVEPAQDGEYRETEHVRRYYELASKF